MRITSEQILSHANRGDANSFGANSKLKQYHTKTWLTIMITMNKSRGLCIYIYIYTPTHTHTRARARACVCVCVCARVHMDSHRHVHACMHVCMNLSPSFWFQSYTKNHYLSCRTALLYFHYIILMQLATILATIHDVLQMLHRMNQYEEGFFRKIS